MPQFIPLSTAERIGHDFTHVAVVTANDLTQATANTAQSFNVVPLPVDSVVEKAQLRVIVPFQNPGDTAFNSTTVDVGDTASATRWFTAKQVNANSGSLITGQQFNATLGGPYAAGQFLTVNFNSMAAKSLVNLKVGELRVRVKLTVPDPVQLTVMTK